MSQDKISMNLNKSPEHIYFTKQCIQYISHKSPYNFDLKNAILINKKVI